MKSWCGVVLACAMFAPLGVAQDGGQEGDGQAEEKKADGDGQTEERKADPEARPERRRGGGFGRMGRMLDPERLRDQLGLSEEQVAQLNTMRAEMQEQMGDMRELFQSGDREAIREKFRGLRETMEGKLNEVLTEEQRAKMEELRSQFGRRGDRGSRERGGERGRGQARGRSRAQLRQMAIEALKLTEEEQAIVLPRLDTVLETRELLNTEARTRREAFLNSARETTDGEALAKLLDEFRGARDADKEQVTAAMDQLREVLTLEQEAQLVGLAILD